MSLSQHDKQAKDRALGQKLLRSNPSIERDALRRALGGRTEPGSGVSLQSFGFLRKLKSHADQAIVRQLVGHGYLRPTDGVKSTTYTLTERGSKLVGLAHGGNSKILSTGSSKGVLQDAAPSRHDATQSSMGRGGVGERPNTQRSVRATSEALAGPPGGPSGVSGAGTAVAARGEADQKPSSPKRAAAARFPNAGTAAVIAWMAFVVLPAVGAGLLWHYFGSKVASAPNVWVGAGFVMLSGVLLLYGVAVCAAMYWVLALLGLVGAGIYGGLAMVGIAVAEGVLVMCGMHIAFTVHERLKARWKVSGESAQCRHERNPRCGTCHAKTFCPHQPGGIADRYKTVKLVSASAEAWNGGSR